MIISCIFSYRQSNATLFFIIVQHGRFHVRKYFRIRTQLLNLLQIYKIFCCDRSINLSHLKSIFQKCQRQFQWIPVHTFSDCKNRIRTDFTERFQNFSSLFPIDFVLEFHSQCCSQSLILIRDLICLIQSSQFNKRNVQTVVKILRSKPCLLMQYQIKICLRHGLILCIILTA